MVADENGKYSGLLQTTSEIFKTNLSKPPRIFVNAPPEDFQKLQQAIAQDANHQFAGAGPALAQRLEIFGTEVEDEEHDMEPLYFTWQQDYIKPQFDSKNGRPVLGIVPHYLPVQNLGDKLAQVLKPYGIQASHPAPELEGRDGLSGGNIDMLPGGICIIGDSDLSDAYWSRYAEAMCGKDSVHLKVSTKWIASTHVDEILRVLPNLKAKKSCAYTALIASPRKALELLAQAPGAPAIYRKTDSPSDLDYQVTRVAGLNRICGTFQQQISGQPWAHTFTPLVQPESWGKKNLYTIFTEAQGDTWGPKACLGMTNKNVLDAINENPIMKEYVLLSQARLDEFKAQILTTMKKALPDCEIDALEVPDVFTGSMEIQNDGSHQLAPGNEASGYSVYPNPTNSVFMNNTLLMPNLYNKTFEDYMLTALNQRGLRGGFVDTLWLHTAKGNLHCAVQTLRSCVP